MQKRRKNLDEINNKIVCELLKDPTNAEQMENAVALLQRHYANRITVQGQEKFSTLIAVYCLAEKNVMASVVFQFLQEIDDKEAVISLANNEFFELAGIQKKKTAFRDEVKRLLAQRKKLEIQAQHQAKNDLDSLTARSMPSYYQSDLSQSVVERILTEGLNIRLRFNEVTKKIEIDGGGKQTLLTTYSENQILTALPVLILDECKACKVKGMTNSFKLIQAYLSNIADINRYNPIHDMLNLHKNTNEQYLEKIFKILNITLPFEQMLIRKWLIQTVAFAFATHTNQVSTEGMLILQGMQGLAKTSFFRVLAGNPLWFNEGVCIDVSNKDTLLNAVSAWISELGEIDSTFKKDQSALKAFITSPLDRIRLPYAPAISEMPRRTSLCGTVNPEKFLKDETGNRRYWIIHIEKIDKKALFSMTQEEVFNMWGYIYTLYLENRRGFLLTDKERKLVEARNLEYMIERKYEAEIRYIVDFSKPMEKWEWVEPVEIANQLKGITAEQVGRVFSAIEREEQAVLKKKKHTRQIYFLPIDWNKFSKSSSCSINY